MANIEENHERGINIHRLNLQAPLLVLVILAPIELIGLVVFVVYLFTHWHDFVSQSSAIFAWFLFFGAACAYTTLAWAVVKVGITLAHGIADVYHKVAHTRRDLLHTTDNYFVYRQNGRIAYQIVAQEQYNTKQQEQLIVPITEEVEVVALPAPVETFQELLASGKVQSALEQGQMLLGYREVI